MIKSAYRLHHEIDQWAEIYFLEGEEYSYLIYLYPQGATIQRTNDTLDVYSKVITGYTKLTPHWDYSPSIPHYYVLENRLLTPIYLKIRENLDFISLYQDESDCLMCISRKDNAKHLGVNITSVSGHYDCIATQFYQVLMRGEKYND